VFLLTCGHVVGNTRGRRIYAFPEGAQEGVYAGEVVETTPAENNDANDPTLLDAALVKIADPSGWSIDYRFAGQELAGTAEARPGQPASLLGAQAGQTVLTVVAVTEHRTSLYSSRNLVHPGDSGSMVVSRPPLG
jgi:hypothetical protein